MKKINLFLKLFIGLSILFALFYKIGFNEVYKTLITFNFFFLPLVFITYIISFILGTLNLKILLNSLNLKINFWKLAKYYQLSWSFGLFIPGRLGEFSLVYFLKKENLVSGKGTAIAVIDKIITVAVTSLFAIVGFFIFFTTEQAIRLMGILILGFLILLFFILSEPGRELIKKYVLRSYSEKFKGFSKTLFFFLREQKKRLLLNALITVIKLVVTALTVYLFFAAFNQNVLFVDVLVITAIGTIISMIPVTISGLGIRESITVFLFSEVGIPTTVTASVMVVALILNYTIAGLSLLYKLDY